jgi:hypothetical protein
LGAKLSEQTSFISQSDSDFAAQRSAKPVRLLISPASAQCARGESSESRAPELPATLIPSSRGLARLRRKLQAVSEVHRARRVPRWRRRPLLQGALQATLARLGFWSSSVDIGARAQSARVAPQPDRRRPSFVRVRRCGGAAFVRSRVVDRALGRPQLASSLRLLVSIARALTLRLVVHGAVGLVLTFTQARLARAGLST